MSENVLEIRSLVPVTPKIYAYHTPGVPYKEGWTKIGYTEKQTVEERIKQQTHTAGIKWQLDWSETAQYRNRANQPIPGEFFNDAPLHAYMERKKFIAREAGTEWFKVSGKDAHTIFVEFAKRGEAVTEGYTLRHEQQEAVEMTMAYFEAGRKEFLWNAKPRFGKTLSAYDLVCRMGFQKVLVVTNRPSIANSWADDFFKFIAPQYPLSFVTENAALKANPAVLTRQAYMDAPGGKGMVAFESLQGLKGSVYFGGKFEKLAWMAKTFTDAKGKKHKGTHFDLLIVDEAHEGVITEKTKRAFDNISRSHTLYLSGTPFKQLALEQFSADQIYNWGYADEQEAKAKWAEEKESSNPYAALPKLALFTYRMSDMVRQEVKKGIYLDQLQDTVEYVFDLNEFFLTNDQGKFIHEADVRNFLHALTEQEKYPFSTPALRQELAHTIWILNRVASVKALENLLKDAEFADVFGDYEIVIAAGDGRPDAETEDNDTLEVEERFVNDDLTRVRKAIKEHDKTITLSVGKLTVGVTVPEWAGVLMLCNMKSPAAYMQAAFRAQNPYSKLTDDGVLCRKETAYVFDFDPDRTLTIFSSFAVDQNPATAAGKGTKETEEKAIGRLLNFFPVIGEDDNGTMVKRDADAIMSILRRLKSTEVVNRGFMSNFLFRNISGIFGSAHPVLVEIINKMTVAKDDFKKKSSGSVADAREVELDETGNVIIENDVIIGTKQNIFGDTKYYDEAQKEADKHTKEVSRAQDDAVLDAVDTIAKKLKAHISKYAVAQVIAHYTAKPAVQKRLKQQINREIDKKVSQLKGDYEQALNIAEAQYEKLLAETTDKKERKAANDSLKKAKKAARDTLTKGIEAISRQTLEEAPDKLVRQVEAAAVEQKQKSSEDAVRDHLRGFARTIPSFLMAYGDDNLCLANFDTYVSGESAVFEEVTGITLDDFLFLRDGGNRTDTRTGEILHLEEGLFDETVFNDAVAVFMQKKKELANYFDEAQKEDIFDYIPPQKTSQIFTPRKVVEKMVNELEAHNPGCFDNPAHTFADLYMKSGLFIAEIVKRLFNSKGLKEAYPDEKKRIRHILTQQVYGMAPTRIIYLIATNFILGFDENLKLNTHTFVQADAAEAAKNGTLTKLVEKHFG